MSESTGNEKGGRGHRWVRVLFTVIGTLFALSVILVLAVASPLVIFGVSAATSIPIAYLMGVSTEE